MKLVTVKGSEVQFPEAAVQGTFMWLEDLLKTDITGFFVVADIACNGMPPTGEILDKYVERRICEPGGTLQTTRRDLARLMILDADDPMRMRLADWDELEVTPVE